MPVPMQSLACHAILLPEDDLPPRRRIAAHRQKNSTAVTEAGTLAAARRLVRDLRFDFALLALHPTDGENLALLREHVFPENTSLLSASLWQAVERQARTS